VAFLFFSCCRILPFITPNQAFNFCGERIFVFSVKRQHKERGGEKRIDSGRAKKRKKKKCLAQMGKEKKGKGKRMGWGKSEPDSDT